MRAITIVLLFLSPWRMALAGGSKPTDQQIAAIVQAVEDEIYDWGYEKNYTDIGTTGAVGEATEVAIFVHTEIDDRGVGGVIYRLMPFGEVVRQFTLRPGGIVVLEGDPWNGFPASQPDTRTVYLDDDWVCTYKQKAIRATFTVDPHVSRARKEEAIQRQIVRLGHSHFLETHPKNTSRKNPPS